MVQKEIKKSSEAEEAIARIPGPARLDRFWVLDNPPRGSEYPTSMVLGPKIHTLNGFWTLKPYYLGTWTLWALHNPKP